ncbi:receptor-like cytosolic serine/threonine-protein kinase RBK2 [Aegilops tauschii subsp. strangulata]|uniref:receptor-like cytosolic serine/threonine-protein kinase RBK2 n=1 Tax=Aegilops tauschii subsp. strangulata TaxID=200361 RepID=UPI003CC8734B
MTDETMGSSTTKTGVVAAPSTPAPPRNDGLPAAWKGAMEAWRSRTKRRLSSGIPSTMSSKLRSLSIRGSSKWRWPSAGQVNVEQHDLCALRLSFRTFSLSELRKATRNFSKENVVGRGGNAKVYRGLLSDGQLVAVKKLSATENDRMESFLLEVGHAVNVRHPNVARLVGVGLEGGEHLVFPFSRLGCLSRRLHGGSGEEGAMPWEARYVPPEYTTHGIFNEKTDVFAFGVVLLELLTGRRAIDGKNHCLVAWVRSFLSSKDEVLKMVDPALGGRYDVEQLRRVTHAAQLCIHTSPAQRPRMSQSTTHACACTHTQPLRHSPAGCLGWQPDPLSLVHPFPLLLAEPVVTSRKGRAGHDGDSPFAAARLLGGPDRGSCSSAYGRLAVVVASGRQTWAWQRRPFTTRKKP